MVWSLMDGRLRDAEGALDGPFCLALAVAIGLCLVGATAHGRLRAYGRSATWVATAVVGQAVGLQLIEAGTNVSYQHYLRIGAMRTGFAPVLLALVAVQALVVAAGLWRIRHGLSGVLRGAFRPWQLA